MKELTRRKKSKRYLWQGAGLLLAGSALLLSCKIILNPAWQSTLLFGGGGAILLGNGFMLYGLLHHADSRDYAEEQKAKASTTQQTHSAPPSVSSPLAQPPIHTGTGVGGNGVKESSVH